MRIRRNRAGREEVLGVTLNLSGRGPPSQFSVTMRITPWMAEERKIKQVTVAYNQVTHSPLLFRSVKKHLKRLFTDFDFVGLGINKEYLRI